MQQAAVPFTSKSALKYPPKSTTLPLVHSTLKLSWNYSARSSPISSPVTTPVYPTAKTQPPPASRNASESAFYLSILLRPHCFRHQCLRPVLPVPR
jgi:hypothetical protein